jgi:hypothetical protein
MWWNYHLKVKHGLLFLFLLLLCLGAIGLGFGLWAGTVNNKDSVQNFELANIIAENSMQQQEIAMLIMNSCYSNITFVSNGTVQWVDARGNCHIGGVAPNTLVGLSNYTLSIYTFGSLATYVLTVTPPEQLGTFNFNQAGTCALVMTNFAPPFSEIAFDPTRQAMYLTPSDYALFTSTPSCTSPTCVLSHSVLLQETIVPLVTNIIFSVTQTIPSNRFWSLTEPLNIMLPTS